MSGKKKKKGRAEQSRAGKGRGKGKGERGKVKWKGKGEGKKKGKGENLVFCSTLLLCMTGAFVYNISVLQSLYNLHLLNVS